MAVTTEEYNELNRQATHLFVALREAQTRLPVDSLERKEIGQLAHNIDCWCRFIEDLPKSKIQNH